MAALLAPAPSRAETVGSSIVAQVRAKTVAVYRFPGAKRSFARFSRRTADGGPRVFLVAQRINGWDRVYLPIRPDGTSGWVRDRAVTLAEDPYALVLHLKAHRLVLYESGRAIWATKAGVGRSVLPTPRGTYFLVELLKQPDPAGDYGPYAFGTSAYSTVLYHFGGGPGQIGLHGTNYPAGLGTDVSHGCIRVSNAAISKLARLLPLGTPVHIQA